MSASFRRTSSEKWPNTWRTSSTDTNSCCCGHLPWKSSVSNSTSPWSSNCSFSSYSSRFRLHHHAHPADCACSFNRILQILVECWQKRRGPRRGSGTRSKLFARHLFPCAVFFVSIQHFSSGDGHPVAFICLLMIFFFGFFLLVSFLSAAAAAAGDKDGGNNPMIRNKT